MDRIRRHRAHARQVATGGGRDSSGASLLEVVISTFILAIVILGLVEFFARGRVWFDHEERKRAATLLAQEAMERAVALPYSEIQPVTDQRTIASVQYAINLSVDIDAPEAGMKTLRSEVVWQATPTAQRAVDLVTFVREE
jgi:Tfp pilus assembly protein PilV